MKQPGTRRRATEERRGQILAAALECFDAIGVSATTIEDIRTTARVSVGSLYHHFPNKEAIAAALYVALIRDYQESARRAVMNAGGPRTRIRAAIEHHVQWSLSRLAETRFLLAHREPEVRKLSDPDVASMNRSLEQELQSWLDVEATRGSMRRMPADVYVSVVLGSAQSFVRRWITESTTTSPEQAIEELAEAAWRAVRADLPRPHSLPHRPRRGSANQ